MKGKLFLKITYIIEVMVKLGNGSQKVGSFKLEIIIVFVIKLNVLNIFNVVPLIRKVFISPPDLKTLNNLFSLVFEFMTAPTTAISIELNYFVHQ